MTIRFARAEDLPSIREIWRTSFPDDSDRDRDAFLELIDLSAECLVAEVDGYPRSMGFFLPATLHTNDGIFSLRYLYAASTLPSARGSGLFANILNTAADIFKKDGISAIYLKPAQPSLVSYYQRLGCISTNYTRLITEKAVPTDYAIQRLSSEAYASKREDLLSGAHISLDDRFVRYAAEYTLPLAVGSVACALLVKQGGIARILELCGQNTLEIRSSLASFCDCTTYQMFVKTEQGNCQGMILPLNETKDWLMKPFDMGLTLD